MPNAFHGGYTVLGGMRGSASAAAGRARRSARERVLARTAVALLAGGLAAEAFAQSAPAGRLVPETFAPAAPASKATIDIGTPASSTPPAGADRLVVAPRQITIDGDPAPLPDAIERLRTALVQRPAEAAPLTLADLYARVNATEREIVDAGYVLVRLVIPPQRITPGDAVRITVVDGYLESIDTSALPTPIAGAVRERVAVLLARRGLLRSEMERALLLAGDLAGVQLRSTLAPGTGTGGVALILDGSYRPGAGVFGLDHAASATVGGYRMTATVAANDAFGPGRQLYLSLQGDPEGSYKGHPRMAIGAIGAQLPVGVHGLTVTPELVSARIRPVPSSGVPPTLNEYARASLRLAYPWLLTPRRMLTVNTAIEQVSQTVKAIGFDDALSADSYRIWRGGLSASRIVGPGAGLSASLRLSKGLGAAAPVFSGTADAPPTRAAARPTFTKLDGELGGSWRDGVWRGNAWVRAQVAGGRTLYGAEQLWLDGANALSSLPPAAHAVDQGATLRAEFGTDRALAPMARGFLYGFAALGAGVIREASALESRTLRARSLGVGARFDPVRLGGDGQAMSITLELGRNHVRALDERLSTRFNAALNWAL